MGKMASLGLEPSLAFHPPGADGAPLSAPLQVWDHPLELGLSMEPSLLPRAPRGFITAPGEGRQ